MKQSISPEAWQNLTKDLQAKNVTPQRFSAAPLPCYLDTRYKVGDTIYIVSSHFKTEGKPATDKIKRLIESEIAG